MGYDPARVVDILPGLVWAAQPSGRIDFFNGRWTEYTGLDPDVPADVIWRAAIHPDDLPRWHERWHSIPTTNEAWELELRVRRRDGAYRWFLCRVAPLIDSAGRVLQWWGIGTDIDNVKRVAEALRASECDRALVVDTIPASIAHEVSQPLAGIITNAMTCIRLLDAKPPNVAAARATASRTIRDGYRASEVVNRLRALYSKREFALEPLDLNEAIREVVALSAHDTQRMHVVVRLELADDLPPVIGDRIQLQQVVLNLLRNALDAMANVDVPRRVVIRTDGGEAERVHVSVEDTGVGFDAQARDKLFDAFYTTKPDGMGIGLSVSRSIVERHHGRLSAAVNAGAGATFSFWLPARVVAEARRSTNADTIVQ